MIAILPRTTLDPDYEYFIPTLIKNTANLHEQAWNWFAYYLEIISLSASCHWFWKLFVLIRPCMIPVETYYAINWFACQSSSRVNLPLNTWNYSRHHVTDWKSGWKEIREGWKHRTYAVELTRCTTLCLYVRHCPTRSTITSCLSPYKMGKLPNMEIGDELRSQFSPTNSIKCHTWILHLKNSTISTQNLIEIWRLYFPPVLSK